MIIITTLFLSLSYVWILISSAGFITSQLSDANESNKLYENVFLFSGELPFFFSSSSCYYEKIRPIWRQQFSLFFKRFLKKKKKKKSNLCSSHSSSTIYNNWTNNDRPRCFQALKWFFFFFLLRSVSALKSERHFVFFPRVTNFTQKYTHTTWNANERGWVSTFAWKKKTL